MPDREGPAQGRDRRRLWRWALVTAAVLLLVLLIGAAAASWHFSSWVLVPNHSPRWIDVGVERVERDRIVLERSPATARPGRYGLIWEGGHAVVGPIVRSDSETVTRRLTGVRGYLVPGIEAGFDSDVYTGNPRGALGIPFREVVVRGELGEMPAWLIPSRSHTWAIVVHGINGDRQTGLRLAPALRRYGLTSLIVSYRDDLGAPSSPDGFHHLGLTEWRDLDAAARFALDRGARRLVLVGHSMGGALVAQFMQHSTIADRVSALILDAPALDWKEILAFKATEMGFPRVAALPVQWAIAARIDVDWDSLDAIAHPEDFQLPILLFHGTDDRLVPIEISEDFAQELPDRVTYFAVPDAGHVQSWNVDPALYDKRLRIFLQMALKTSQARP